MRVNQVEHRLRSMRYSHIIHGLISAPVQAGFWKSCATTISVLLSSIIARAKNRDDAMTKRHEGKTAIISGAASGIGQASAIRLAKEGAEIIIADRDEAEKTSQLIAEFGGKATAFQCDVTNPTSVEAFRTAVNAAGARCDILVNNAGIYPMQTFDEMTFEDWRRVLTVNLDSMFLMTKAFIDGMKQRKWGRIINIASDTVNLVLPGFTHYVASKAGVIGVHAVARDRIWPKRHNCQCYRTGIDPDFRHRSA